MVSNAPLERRVAAVLLAGVLAACGSQTSPESGTTTSSRPVVTSTAGPLDLPRIRLVEGFITAVNAGQVARAMNMMGESPVVSDCDYRHHRVVSYTSRVQVRSWINQQIADHNRFVLAAMENANPDPRSSGLAITFATRTSDSLRDLGFARGIHPRTGAKARFEAGPQGERIEAFANGPIGGDPAECLHPEPIP